MIENYVRHEAAIEATEAITHCPGNLGRVLYLGDERKLVPRVRGFPVHGCTGGRNRDGREWPYLGDFRPWMDRRPQFSQVPVHCRRGCPSVSDRFDDGAWSGHEVTGCEGAGDRFMTLPGPRSEGCREFRVERMWSATGQGRITYRRVDEIAAGYGHRTGPARRIWFAEGVSMYSRRQPGHGRSPRRGG